jgi:hypothetical protein
VFDALPMAVDQRVLGKYNFSQPFLQKDGFIQKTMPVSLHMLIRSLMGSFPAAFVAPSPNREYLDTLQRWSLVPIKDQSLAAQPGVPSRPYFLGMGPSR